MSNRSIDATTLAQFQARSFYLIWILRLDIQTEPVYIHTGFGTLTFGVGYDVALQGFSFLGVGNIGQIDTINDSVNGSQGLNLVLPGVDLANDYLKQLVNNADLWQHYSGYLWMATIDNTGALVGKPVRVKSARMDQLTMLIDPDNNTGTITIALESQQAYSGDALFSRWAEQSEIDNTDTSQTFAAAIANAVPGIGQTSTNPFGSVQGPGGRYGGGGSRGLSLGYKNA